MYPGDTSIQETWLFIRFYIVYLEMPLSKRQDSIIIFAKMYPEMYRVRIVPETYNLYASLVLHLIALKTYAPVLRDARDV